MSNEEFVTKAKKLVSNYVSEHNTRNKVFDVRLVWDCYLLGNQKCLMSTTLNDGMYFEVTYNKGKDEFYFDTYKKVENILISNA